MTTCGIMRPKMIGFFSAFKYSPAMATQEIPANFEQALKELEKLIGELERGEQPIEDQLKSFEKGVSLSRDCVKRLEEIERRVEILIQNADGKMATSSFKPEE
jgi:exodeoxyribonuclease VII small subunit